MFIKSILVELSIIVVVFNEANSNSNQKLIIIIVIQLLISKSFLSSLHSILSFIFGEIKCNFDQFFTQGINTLNIVKGWN